MPQTVLYQIWHSFSPLHLKRQWLLYYEISSMATWGKFSYKKKILVLVALHLKHQWLLYCEINRMATWGKFSYKKKFQYSWLALNKNREKFKKKKKKKLLQQEEIECVIIPFKTSFFFKKNLKKNLLGTCSPLFENFDKSSTVISPRRLHLASTFAGASKGRGQGTIYYFATLQNFTEQFTCLFINECLL